jgi:hypothetical protein
MTITLSITTVLQQQLEIARTYYVLGMIGDARKELLLMLATANREMPGLRPSIFRALNRMRHA